MKLDGGIRQYGLVVLDFFVIVNEPPFHDLDLIVCLLYLFTQSRVLLLHCLEFFVELGYVLVQFLLLLVCVLYDCLIERGIFTALLVERHAGQLRALNFQEPLGCV